MSPHDLGNMHESAFIFVPAATFGQLIGKCDTTLQPPQTAKEKLKLSDLGSLSNSFPPSSCHRYQPLKNSAFAPEPGLFRRPHIGVGFDVAPLLIHDTTQLALHGFKCIVDNFFERFVSTVIHLPFISHKLMPGRHGHVDPTPVRIPFVMVMIGLFNCDVAAVDVIAKSFESFCVIQNKIVDLVRFFQTPIR